MARKPVVKEDDTGVDLTPMLDIVFIMLIFFIVTATFVRERGLDVFNPSACEPNCPPSGDIPIVLYVNSRNEIRIPDMRVGGLRTISRGAVRANVERARAELPRSPVIIQADPRADMGIVVVALDQARAAGAPSVTIATGEMP